MKKIFPGDETNAIEKPAYLTEKELAARLSVSVKWLQKMRLSGGGIPYCKFGASVRYPLDRVKIFEEQSLRTNTADLPARFERRF